MNSIKPNNNHLIKRFKNYNNSYKIKNMKLISAKMNSIRELIMFKA